MCDKSSHGLILYHLIHSKSRTEKFEYANGKAYHWENTPALDQAQVFGSLARDECEDPYLRLVYACKYNSSLLLISTSEFVRLLYTFIFFLFSIMGYICLLCLPTNLEAFQSYYLERHVIKMTNHGGTTFLYEQVQAAGIHFIATTIYSEN